jgi:hypothetical protein
MLDVAKALGVNDPRDYQDFFEKLLQAIKVSSEALEALL